MKNFVTAAVSALLMGLTLIPQVLALEFSKQPYQATYEQISPKGTKNTRRMFYDGAGHARMEMTSSRGRNTLAIIDVPNHKMLMKMGSDSQIVEMPLKESDLDMLPKDMEAIKKTKKPIGAKVICGRPSHGFTYVIGNANEEVWYDDQTGVITQSTYSNPELGTSTSTCVQFSTNKPDAAVFKLQ